MTMGRFSRFHLRRFARETRLGGTGAKGGLTSGPDADPAPDPAELIMVRVGTESMDAHRRPSVVDIAGAVAILVRAGASSRGRFRLRLCIVARAALGKRWLGD